MVPGFVIVEEQGLRLSLKCRLCVKLCMQFAYHTTDILRLTRQHRCRLETFDDARVPSSYPEGPSPSLSKRQRSNEKPSIQLGTRDAERCGGGDYSAGRAAAHVPDGSVLAPRMRMGCSFLERVGGRGCPLRDGCSKAGPGCAFRQSVQKKRGNGKGFLVMIVSCDCFERQARALL